MNIEDTRKYIKALEELREGANPKECEAINSRIKELFSRIQSELLNGQNTG